LNIPLPSPQASEPRSKRPTQKGKESRPKPGFTLQKSVGAPGERQHQPADEINHQRKKVSPEKMEHKSGQENRENKRSEKKQ